MDIWKHCLISQRKFGGEPTDYLPVHRFIDHSKLYFYHFRHRLLMHNLYGVELAVEKFGDTIQKSDAGCVLVRDVAAAHCSEDLSGRIPTLWDWLHTAEGTLGRHFEPMVHDDPLSLFVNRPFLRSGLRSSLMITMSDFGVGLAEQFLGIEAAMQLRGRIPAEARVARYLMGVSFDEKWMHTPDRAELRWLAKQEELHESGTATRGRVAG